MAVGRRASRLVSQLPRMEPASAAGASASKAASERGVRISNMAAVLVKARQATYGKLFWGAIMGTFVTVRLLFKLNFLTTLNHLPRESIWLTSVIQHLKQLAFFPAYVLITFGHLAFLGPGNDATIPLIVRAAMLFLSVCGVDYNNTSNLQLVNSASRVGCLLLELCGFVDMWTAYRSSTMCVAIMNLVSLCVHAPESSADSTSYPPLGGSFEGSVCNTVLLFLSATWLREGNREWLCQIVHLDQQLALPLDALRSEDMDTVHELIRSPSMHRRSANPSTSEAAGIFDTTSSYGTESELAQANNPYATSITDSVAGSLESLD